MGDISIPQIAELVRTHDDIVTCGHISPDGDCLGSQLAFAAICKRLGKRVNCLLATDDAIDYGLRFMPGMDEMGPAADFKGNCGLFVTLDVPTAERMGDAAVRLHRSAPATLTIDHHLTQKPFSQDYLIQPDTAATTLIVWELAGELGFQDDVDVATCCYTGLITDTGRFQYQNTDTHALAAAGQMVNAGADPARIASEVYQNRSRQSLALEARMLDHLEYLADGQFAVSHLMRSDFVETGAHKTDAEPLIDVLRSIRGIRVACMLRQLPDGVRGSLRAKDDTDVAAIAESFGGGGHRAAAGFTLKGTMDQVREQVARALKSLA